LTVAGKKAGQRRTSILGTVVANDARWRCYSDPVLFRNSIVAEHGETVDHLRGFAGTLGAVLSAAPLQFLILLVSSWLGRHQTEAIEYLRAENRVNKAGPTEATAFGVCVLGATAGALAGDASLDDGRAAASAARSPGSADAGLDGAS
jgi:hypothetical protein